MTAAGNGGPAPVRDGKARFLLPPWWLLISVLSVSLLVRFGVFYSIWGDLRHGSAPYYGSAALGVFNGEGASYRKEEVRQIDAVRMNRGADFRLFHRPGERVPLTIFLPGPAYFLGWLWHIIPLYDFTPLIWLQILLESVLVTGLALVFWDSAGVRRWVGLLVVAFAALNPITISKVVAAGYDFWPQFAVLALFICSVLALRRNGSPGLLLIGGVAGAVSLWCREIASLVPFFIAPAICWYLWKKEGNTLRFAVTRGLFLLLPCVISLGLLSLHRYQLSGNMRPTRNTFWHVFFAGVGQFSNPLDLTNDDRSVYEFQAKLTGGRKLSIEETRSGPDCPYEQSLRTEAERFAARYPLILARNFVYRVGIMMSPTLLKNAEYIPRRLARPLFWLGVLLLPLWVVGLVLLRRDDSVIFIVSAAIFLHFFVVFGWIYVVGRVILPFLALNVLLYVTGARWFAVRALSLIGLIRPGAFPRTR